MKRNKTKKVIVVGNDHFNTLNVVRALGKEGFSPIVIIINDNQERSFVLKSRYISRGIVTKEKDVIELLLKDLKEPGNKVPLITTYDGASVLIDNHFEQLSHYFILPSISNHQGELTRMMDKELQMSFARKVGLDIPFSISVSLDSIREENFKDMLYPCIVKPQESYKGSKHNFRICGNKKELQNALTSLKNEIKEVLVQQFIPNDELVLIAGVRTPEKTNFIIGEIDKTKYSSSAHNIGASSMAYWNPTTVIDKKCKELIELIDYYGCYSIEFVRSDIHKNGEKKYFFMEMNLRTDAMLYNFTASGVNLPALWAASCYGDNIDLRPSKKKIYSMNEILYIKENFSLSFFKDIFKADTFTLFNLKDPKPLFYKLIYH